MLCIYATVLRLLHVIDFLKELEAAESVALQIKQMKERLGMIIF